MDRFAKLKERLEQDGTWEQRLEALNDLGWSLRFRQIRAARGYAEEAYRLALGEGREGDIDQAGLAYAQRTLSYLEMHTGDLERASQYALEALQHLQSLGDEHAVADIYGILGKLNFALGDPAGGMEYSLKAYEQFARLGDKIAQGIVANSLAVIHYESGNTERATELFEQALALLDGDESRYHLATTLNNLAFFWQQEADPQKALAYAQRALEMIRDMPESQNYPSFLNTMGLIKLDLGFFEDGLIYLQAALDGEKKLGNLMGQVENMVEIGRAKARQNNAREGIQILQEAAQLAREAGAKRELSRCLAHLSLIHEEQGDYRQALVALREVLAIRQEIYDRQVNARLAYVRLENELETARKDAEIHILERTALEKEVARQRKESTKLEKMVVRDPLTGLYNRRYFYRAGAQMVARARRSGAPLTLVFVDLDHFKQVNDRYGHQAGDDLLRKAATILRSGFREQDIVCRFGGEEFVIILPHTGVEEAFRAAERLRQGFAADGHFLGEHELHLTLSAGVATLEPDDTGIESLVERADEGLYRAKDAGRNRVLILKGKQR